MLTTVLGMWPSLPESTPRCCVHGVQHWQKGVAHAWEEGGPSMLYAPHKMTWWAAVILAFVSVLLLLLSPAKEAGALVALLGLLLLIVATKIKRL